VESTGTLSIDQLCRIADLSIEQLVLNVSRDETLANRDLVTLIVLNRDILRMYANLDRRQRRMLFSKQGLGLSDLTPEQWPMVRNLIQRRNSALLQNPDARVAFIGSSTKQGSQTKHTITLTASGTQSRPTIWTILTPKYEVQKKQS
jgi:hypothetical protein